MSVKDNPVRMERHAMTILDPSLARVHHSGKVLTAREVCLISMA